MTDVWRFGANYISQPVLLYGCKTYQYCLVDEIEARETVVSVDSAHNFKRPTSPRPFELPGHGLRHRLLIYLPFLSSSLAISSPIHQSFQ
jgi:hypothetical protein